MPPKYERKKSIVAVEVGGAQEDGDFVALRESREIHEKRIQTEDEDLAILLSSPTSHGKSLRGKNKASFTEKDKRQTEALTLEAILDLPEIERAQSPAIIASPGVTKAPTARPGSSRPKSAAQRKKTPGGPADPWDVLTDACFSDLDNFKSVLSDVKSKHNLIDPKLQDPKNSQNILHFVLENADDPIIDYVVELADPELIQQEFEVTVSKITGKKNALHQLVMSNDLNRLKVLLYKLSMPVKKNVLLKETRVEIKGQRPRTFTCLHLAAFYGYTDIVIFLLELGIDVNHLNAKKDTSLLWAARWGHVDCVRTMLLRGALTDLENDKGSTAIYWAVRYGHLDTVQLLAKEGKANVNQTRKLGLVAPINLACALGLQEIVVILLDFGADPNMTIRGGETPIHHAAREGFSTIIEFLLKRGATIDAADERGDTALLLAARYGKAKAMQTLLNHGANVNTKNLMGEGVWEIAAANEVDLILKLLVIHQKKIAQDSGNEERSIGLGLALVNLMFISPRAEVFTTTRAEVFTTTRAEVFTTTRAEVFTTTRAEVFTTTRAEVFTTTRAEVFTTTRAEVFTTTRAEVFTTTRVEVFTTTRAEVFTTTYLNTDEHQIDKDQPKADRSFSKNSDLLSSPGVNSLIFLAASYGNLERLNLLFNMKIDAGVTDENGNSFLHHAALHNQGEVIKCFHKRVSPDIINNMGNTPLHEACTRGQHDAILELINVKAMANIRNKKGDTALHVAAYSSAIQPISVSNMMDYVIRTHPYECLNIKDNEGNSCLHIAAKHAKPEVLWEFRFVRFKDADVDGNVPLHEAVREGEPECLDTMLDIYDAMKRDCDINHQNHKQETPLYLAAREGFVDGVKRLLLFGADISMADDQGNTVLHELTKLVVEDPIHKGTHMELIDVILNHASVWHCTKHKITFHESDKDQLADLKRQGILTLVMDIPNSMGLSVLDYACKLGAATVVRLLTNMKDVTVFRVGKNIKYDVTHITPRTNETLPSSFSGGGTVSPTASCLEWLLAMDNPVGASKVLDIQPFSDIERAYSSVAAWAYAIIMVFHIAYMGIFTWSGVHLLEKERNNSNDGDKDRIEMVMYIIVPIEPAFIILYNTYRLIKMTCLGQFQFKFQQGVGVLLGEILPFLVYIIYSLFVIIWIILYAVDYSRKDYFLSIALLIGWLISIGFTRGFKVIHYFWRMIQNMILKDIFKFMVIYLFVLLAFSFAMHVAIQFSSYLSEKFPNPAYTMFMVFNLMVGMTELFDGELENNTDSKRNDLYLKIIYLIYIILATIVLLNLLIAMMNDSYQAILQKQSLSWRIESVQLGVDVEKSFPATFTFFSKIKVIKGFICSSDRDKNLKRWYIEVPVAGEGYPEISDVEEEKQVLAEIQANMREMETKLTEQIHSLRTNMDSIHLVLRNVEQALENKKTHL